MGKKILIIILAVAIISAFMVIGWYSDPSANTGVQQSKSLQDMDCVQLAERMQFFLSSMADITTTWANVGTVQVPASEVEQYFYNYYKLLDTAVVFSTSDCPNAENAEAIMETTNASVETTFSVYTIIDENGQTLSMNDFLE